METLVEYKFLKEQYAGKKVFVTGHTGFKGSWLLAILNQLGARVRGYALAPSYQGGLFELLPADAIGESIIADIRDRQTLAEAILSFEPDYVFHLAAQPLVRKSYEMPAYTFDVNATGTANLLEALTRIGNKCNIVVITTDKVYENREAHILYKEEDRLGGHDPYSASKACAEIVTSSFRQSFFHDRQNAAQKKQVASARAGNVIGGGDWSLDRIVPDIIRALQSGKTVEVRNPNAVRPWQHVLEPLAGYLLLAALMNDEARKLSPAYNFGPYPDDHLRVHELVEQAVRLWEAGNWKDVSDKQQPHEATLLQLDINRAVSELGWRPRLNASEAIAWTIDWYRQPEAKRAEFSFSQITNYFAL